MLLIRFNGLMKHMYRLKLFYGLEGAVDYNADQGWVKGIMGFLGEETLWKAG